VKLVVDENLGRELVEELKQQGHQVWFVGDVQPGLKNGAVLAYATQQQALLVTADKTDFGRLIFQQRQFCLGLLVVRLPVQMPLNQKIVTILEVTAAYKEDLLGKVTVITEREVRMRQLPIMTQLPPEQ